MKKLLTIALLFTSVQLFAQGQFQIEAAGNLIRATGQIKQLAEAIPGDKYSWAPEDGVRSVAGVIAHVVSANYFFGSKIGGTVPEGINMMNLEKEITGASKEKAIEALNNSSEFFIEALKNLKDENLMNKVEFPFPGEYTEMTAALIGFSHIHEHLGQLIAYARMNGITPPWSMPQGGE